MNPQELTRDIIAYAETIMKPDAAILQVQYFGDVGPMLEYSKTKVDAGEYRQHTAYGGPGRQVVDKRARDSVSFRTPENVEESMQMYHTMLEYTHQLFNMKDGDQIYLTNSEIYMHPTGVGLKMHVDDHVLDKKTGEVIGADYYRGITAVVYLNDDFEGGELWFPDQNILIKPKPGLMVVFPSNKKFPHQVNPITSGRRFAYQRVYGIEDAATGNYVVQAP